MVCPVLILIAVLAIILIINLGSTKEHGSNITHPQHLGLGAYPPGLYGSSNRNIYYADDLKAVMRYSDDYEAMAGLKFPIYDINKQLEQGRHSKRKTVNYI